jgi:hypothetical protein
MFVLHNENGYMGNPCSHFPVINTKDIKER